MEENRTIGVTESAAANAAETDCDILDGGDASPVTAEAVENGQENAPLGEPEDADTSEPEAAGDRRADERREYERLVKERFKELYAEDTQKLINRRFRKYKVLEEKCKTLEQILAEKEEKLGESMSTIAAFEERLQTELETAIKATEERVLREVRARRARPAENAVSPRMGKATFDVSELTRSERASLAMRAAKGERIKF